jgi:hypothetical protein
MRWTQAGPATCCGPTSSCTASSELQGVSLCSHRSAAALEAWPAIFCGPLRIDESEQDAVVALCVLEMKGRGCVVPVDLCSGIRSSTSRSKHFYYLVLLHLCSNV